MYGRGPHIAIEDGIKDEKMRSSLDRIHSLYTDAPRRPVETAVWEAIQ